MATAAAAAKNKIVRAYTAKDIESDNLECVLINQLNRDIYSIDDGDLSDKITVPVGAHLHNSWAKGTELESSFLKHSATLSTKIEKMLTGAEEGTPEALLVPLKQYINDVCNSTYQNEQDEAIQEWVVLAKNNINENLAIKSKSWWADIIIYSPSSNKITRKKDKDKDTDTVPYEIKSIIRSIINETNSLMYRTLTTYEQKQRDTALQLIVKTLETTAKKTSENSEVCLRLTNQVGKLASFVYKTQYERCQKQLKLWNMEQYVDKNTTDFRALASSIFTKIKSMFSENHLNLPKSTSIEVRGKNKKGEPFILALFSSPSEAKTFEHQAAEGRRKKVTTMKTQRLEPQDAEAFPLVSWQDAAVALKRFATERVNELKTEHEGDESKIAKIDICKTRIDEMKVWRMYQPRVQKHFFEFLCPFRPGQRYHTSTLTSPFSTLIISDLK